MATFDAAKLMPDAHEENLLRQIQNRRLYTPLPCLHVSLAFLHPICM